MITVHHLENSRSQRVLWLLEELHVPYEVKRYERDAKTGLGPPELYDVHPLGKSPVITDGDVTVAETGAIFEYLLDSYDTAHRLHAERGTPDARAMTYWLHYAEGSAMTPLLLKLIFSTLPDRVPLLMRPLVRAVAKGAQKSFIDPRIKEHMDYLDNALARSGWFIGDKFSAADIMLSFPLEAAASRYPLKDHPHVVKFLAHCHRRLAYQKALETGGPYAYA